jgi:hypothetical protein
MMEFNRNFPYGAGKTERVIEIPWALSKYNGEPRVLEVGCSFTCENPEYIQGLMALNIPELHGIDVSSVKAPHFIKRTADVRKSGYETGFFDFVLCVSTLEHVGKDNTKYYKPVAELPRNRQSQKPNSTLISNRSASLPNYRPRFELCGPAPSLE